MWDDPDARVVKYRIAFAARWRLHPRAVDDLYVDEFDHFAKVTELAMREEEKQRAEMEKQRRAARARTGRR